MLPNIFWRVKLKYREKELNIMTVGSNSSVYSGMIVTLITTTSAAQDHRSLSVITLCAVFYLFDTLTLISFECRDSNYIINPQPMA